METGTKIHLSKLETELVQNKEWILTKHAIIKKVYRLFGQLHENYKQITEQEETELPEFFKNSGGKISKGENYQELPYVILDYPAVFSKENIFAIRTMFWWGNFFSISLHVSGKYCRRQKDFLTLLLYLKEKDFFVCVNETEWQHHFEPSNYIAAAALDERLLIEILNRDFFKISKNIELNRWNEAPQFLNKTFSEIVEFIKISFPAGEKVPLPAFPKAATDL
ncbi:MAG: hypothetical protein ABI472_09685 [Ginsengibacter sp.]